VKGQSAYSTDDFARAIPIVKPDALQSWAHALDDQFVRPGARLQELMDEHGCTFVAFSPLAQGRLLDKFDPTKPPTFEPGDHRLGNSGFGAEAIAALKPKLEKLKARFGATTEDLSAVAQRYILNLNNVACVIPGFRNERQVKCNLAAVDRELSDADMDFIREALA
jgi:myo-inositol catabolism protein IolS